MTSTSRYTNTRGAAKRLACSTSYLEKRRGRGGGPRFLKIGKAVRYSFDDLDLWVSSLTHESIAEYSGRRLNLKGKDKA